jgi:hypothetical protein
MKDSFTMLFESPQGAQSHGGRENGMQSAFPVPFRIAWMCLSPLGVALAGRIAWEKTVWTVARGPQMVGFSLIHIHPFFAIAGTLCACLLMLWLLPAAIFAIVRRRSIAYLDIVMILIAVFVTAAMVTPDAFFAR